MKNFRMMLVSVLLTLPLLVQAQQELFKKYSDMKGVSCVYISKTMLEMNPSLITKDIYIGNAASNMNSVQIISTLDAKIKAELMKDIRTLLKSSRYELLMKQKGTVSSSEFYVSRKGDKIKEFVMVTNGAASLKFVYFEGDMTTKDVQNLLLYQNTSENTTPVRTYQMDELRAMGIHVPDIDWNDLQKTLKSDAWKKFMKDMKKLADSES